mgnify:CR=1 FL=1
MNKQLLFNEEARHKIQEGINVVANAVKVTLGPKGRNVILDQEYGQPHITKDGVSVAKEIELKDKYQNVGVKLIKSVANKTVATASGVLKFASGSEVDANSTYGSWSGPTYSWSSNQTYATLTSANAASLNVTMASRGKTYSTSTRSATITRTASFTYTLSSTYGGASKSNSAGATATVT